MRTNISYYVKCSLCWVIGLTVFQCVNLQNTFYFSVSSPFIFVLKTFHAQLLLFPIILVLLSSCHLISKAYIKIVFFYYDLSKAKNKSFKGLIFYLIIPCLLLNSAWVYDVQHSVYGSYLTKLLAPSFKDQSLLPIIQTTLSECMAGLISLFIFVTYILILTQHTKKRGNFVDSQPFSSIHTTTPLALTNSAHSTHSIIPPTSSQPHLIHRYKYSGFIFIGIIHILALLPILISIPPFWYLISKVYPAEQLRYMIVLLLGPVLLSFINHIIFISKNFQARKSSSQVTSSQAISSQASLTEKEHAHIHPSKKHPYKVSSIWYATRIWYVARVSTIMVFIYMMSAYIFYIDPHYMEGYPYSTLHMWKGYLRACTDADGDQASRWFDQDCDDQNAHIYPQALDWPHDGIDQDCDGVDATNTSHMILNDLNFPTPKTSGTPLTSQAINKKLQALPTWKKPQHIVWITIDTLRADYIPTHQSKHHTYNDGHPNSATAKYPPYPLHIPAMKLIQSQSLVFQQAYTPAFITRHAIPSILGGRLFNQLQKKRAGLALQTTPQMSFVFRTLQQYDYQTQAHLPHYLAQYWPDDLQLFNQVFHYASPYHLKDKSSADAIINGVIQQWKSQYKQTHLHTHNSSSNQKSFTATWIHLVEPHEPYVCHHTKYGKDERACYASEIEKVDQALMRLIQAAQQLGIWSNMWVAITSDHGEEFAEHGGRFHGKTLFEESIRVPLVIKDPNVSARSITTPVSVVHLGSWMISLLDLAQFQAAQLQVTQLQAKSIHPLTDQPSVSQSSTLHDPSDEKKARVIQHPWFNILQDTPISPHDIWVDGIRHNDRPNARSVALIQFPWKAIYNWQNDKIQLYNLQDDPREKQSTHQLHSDQAQQMKKIIRHGIQTEMQWEIQSILKSQEYIREQIREKHRAIWTELNKVDIPDPLTMLDKSETTHKSETVHKLSKTTTSNDPENIPIVNMLNCEYMLLNLSLCNVEMQIDSLPSKSLLKIQWYYYPHQAIKDSIKIQLQVFRISQSLLILYKQEAEILSLQTVPIMLSELSPKFKHMLFKSGTIHKRTYESFAGRFPSHLWPARKILHDALQINISLRHKRLCTLLSVYRFPQHQSTNTHKKRNRQHGESLIRCF